MTLFVEQNFWCDVMRGTTYSSNTPTKENEQKKVYQNKKSLTVYDLHYPLEELRDQNHPVYSPYFHPTRRYQV